MKPVRFTAFLFYRYYSDGKDNDPYFRTPGSMTMLVYIQLMLILAIFDKVDLLNFITGSKTQKRVIMFVKLLPIFLLLYLMIK